MHMHVHQAGDQPFARHGRCVFAPGGQRDESAGPTLTIRSALRSPPCIRDLRRAALRRRRPCRPPGRSIRRSPTRRARCGGRGRQRGDRQRGEPHGGGGLKTRLARILADRPERTVDCCMAMLANLELVQVVFHDAAVAAGAVALERVDVAVRPAPLAQARPGSPPVRRSSSFEHRRFSAMRAEMRGIGRADDHRGHLRPSRAPHLRATVAMSQRCLTAIRSSVRRIAETCPSRRNPR